MRDDRNMTGIGRQAVESDYTMKLVIMGTFHNSERDETVWMKLTCDFVKCKNRHKSICKNPNLTRHRHSTIVKLTTGTTHHILFVYAGNT